MSSEPESSNKRARIESSASGNGIGAYRSSFPVPAAPAPTQGSPNPRSGESTANPSRPEPLEGRVLKLEGRVCGGQYHIDKSNFGANDFEHGWIILPTTITDTKKNKEFKVDASILNFETEEKTTEVHGESTANPSRPEPLEGRVLKLESRVCGGQYHIDGSNFGANDFEHGWIILPTTIADTKKNKEFKVDASFLNFETEEKATEVHGVLTASPSRPEPVIHCQFVRTNFEDNAIEHGLIIQTIGNIPIKIEASFLHFTNQNEATDVHCNLSLRLKGESFLRSYFVIERHDGFWVAVEKIDSSLHDYQNFHPLSWDINPNTRLPPNYQDIIRDIIRGMCLLHQQGFTHGNLSSKSIVIIKHRAKLAFITHDSLHYEEADFCQLRKMFMEVLGTNVYHHELTNFHVSAWVNHWSKLRKLYFHPLLMSRGERFLLPVRTSTRLHYRTAVIQTQRNQYRTMFGSGPPWRHIVLSNQQYQVLHAKLQEYQENSWGQFLFVRNTIVHINGDLRAQNAPIKREAELENDLSSMFPYFLIRVYQFFDLHEITPSVRMPVLGD